MRSGLFALGILVSMLGCSFVMGALEDGIVGYYPFEGHFADRSWNGHDGTPVGNGFAYVDGILGQGLDLDGVETFVHTGTWDPAADTGQFSVACWARYRNGGVSKRQGLIGKRNQYSVGDFYWTVQLVETADRTAVETLYFRASEGSAGTLSELPVEGQWRFIVATFDGTIGRLYVDGWEVASNTLVLDPADTHNNLVIGAAGYNEVVENPFSGTIDEVMIWNRVISEQEVGELYNGGIPIELWLYPGPQAVINGGFENPFIGLDGSEKDGDIPGWTITLDSLGTRGVYNPTATDFLGQAPGGQNVLWLQNAAVKQTLNMIIEPDVFYRLQVEVGGREGEVTPYGIFIRSGGNILATTSGYTTGNGTFERVVLEYHAAQGDPAVGTAMRVMLSQNDSGTGFRGYFDNVWLIPRPDCNGNGIPDIDEDGDSDGDGVLDECGDTPNVHNVTQDTWYFKIQEAINAAVYGDEIAVGPGWYRESIDFQGKSIHLRSFSGEPEGTIIDGTGGLHAVQCVNGEDPNTVLEGFTITGGSARSDGQTSNSGTGGGMCNFRSSPTVINCIFINNSADSGGGMSNRHGAPVIRDCVFIGNAALEGDGGGIYNYNCDATLIGCAFKENSADNGAGMHSIYSSLDVVGCVFSDNTVNQIADGGGISHHYSNLGVRDCTFRRNWAVYGGGIYCDRAGLEVNNCTFEENDGGGIFNSLGGCIVNESVFRDNSSTSGGAISVQGSYAISSCIFSGNTASMYGGAISNDRGNSTVTNCAFYGNEANFGGGIYNYSNSHVINCLFSGNRAFDTGGGIHNFLSSSEIMNCVFSGNVADIGGGMYTVESSPTVTNCTFGGNVGETAGSTMGFGSDPRYPSSIDIFNCIIRDGSDWLSNDGEPAITINYSNVQGGWAGAGSNNIDADPYFVDLDGDDNLMGTADDNLRLLVTSPCIDAGDTWLMANDIGDVDMDGNTEEAVPFDLDGNDRYVEVEDVLNRGRSLFDLLPVVDMGAYEYQEAGDPCSGAEKADFNCDGIVDMSDLAYFAGVWLMEKD